MKGIIVVLKETYSGISNLTDTGRGTYLVQARGSDSIKVTQQI